MSNDEPDLILHRGLITTLDRTNPCLVGKDSDIRAQGLLGRARLRLLGGVR